MGRLRDFLAWNASARDPVIFTILFAAVGILVIIVVARPRLYIPLVLFTAPLPKLFTITQYESWGNHQTAAGFSVADLVLLGGALGLIARSRGVARRSESQGLERSLGLWCGAIVLSVGVGIVLWPEAYQASNALYAARYILTLLSYGVALPYAECYCNDASLRKLMRNMALAGNFTIVLGVLYYFAVGSGAGTTVNDMLWNADATVFRNYLFFFDYGIDMGYFVVMIGILNLILISSSPSIFNRIVSVGGLAMCVLSVFLLGERVNILVLACSLGWFLWETRNAGGRSLRTSVAFKLACLIAVAFIGYGVLRVIAPEQMIHKFNEVTAQEYAADVADAMSQANVPSSVVSLVASLPIGDFAVRLAFSVASLWFFFQHPLGVGFWGEFAVVGWYAHHEVIKVAVEQSLLGLVAFGLVLFNIRRFLWSGRNAPGVVGQLGVLLRSATFGFFVALVAANTVVLDMKFGTVYWTLLGLWAVVSRRRATRLTPVILAEAELAHA